MSTININQKLQQINTLWDPKIIAELNGQHVKLAKIKGEFVWHAHEEEDELFYVVDGILEIHLRDRVEILKAGECIVIPKGIEHMPVAHEEVSIMLFEPASTLNTGNAGGEKMREKLDWI